MQIHLLGMSIELCIKLHKACKDAKASQGFFIKEKDWVQRYCIDVTNLKIYNPQEYIKVKPFNRLFIWPKDVRDAVGELNLKAAN